MYGIIWRFKFNIEIIVDNRLLYDTDWQHSIVSLQRKRSQPRSTCLQALQ